MLLGLLPLELHFFQAQTAGFNNTPDNVGQIQSVLCPSHSSQNVAVAVATWDICLILTWNHLLHKIRLSF